MTRQEAVRIRGLSKAFPHSSDKVLDGIEATVYSGEITGVVGPDGSGKTTLLRLIAGLLTPTSGAIEAFGFDATKESARVRELLGYMPQKFGLYEDLTVLENLTLYAKLRNLPRALRRSRFEELLEFTGLSQFQKRLARRLSGGMKQKLGLACAMITMPRLLVLDEPGVGVDPLSRRELWRMVREQTRDDTAVIWSTSYLDEAQKCDSTLLLNRGKLLYSGSPRDFVGQMNDRVVKVGGIAPERKRAEVMRILSRDRVVDATIQGSAIRATLSAPFIAERDESLLFDGYRAEKAEPCFEDRFIEVLGGAPKTIFSERAPSRERNVAKLRADTIVEARGLTKRFGSFIAASDIEFSIRRGEIFGLLGPNGAGKSTTFKMLCGLLRPSSGDGFVGGVSLRRSASEARRKLGYMAQKFSLYSDLTVEQNLYFYAGVYGMTRQASREAIERTTSEYDLERYTTTRAGELPLGFKQRLALAAATIHSPEALFLDEPTSGVDPLARREFWNRVNAFAERGVAVLVTTHFMDEAEYCDRVALILDGRKIAQGTPDELKNAAASEGDDEISLEDAFVHLIRKERERKIC